MSENTFKIEVGGFTATASVKVKTPKDVVMFVPGTTDPTNMKALNHEANRSYWRQKEKDTDNFWSAVKKLKPQFLDLHIEDQFFSWSGDNSTEARNEAASRLVDLFLRVYENWTDQEVMLHLIGHSHGGNVINEFTKVIAQDTNFPEKWMVKSIIYLSTPFFQEQHQLDHTKLHEECKIINVYNEYDITQRFIADFSLKNLEILIQDFYPEEISAALATIRNTDFTVYTELGGMISHINDHTEGPAIWTQTANLLNGIDQLVSSVYKTISCMSSTTLLVSQKDILVNHCNDILAWARERGAIFQANRAQREGGYGRAEFFDDLGLLELLDLINEILAIDTGTENSYLLGLINDVLKVDDSGVVFKIDDTSWSPENQIKEKYPITQVNITEKDLYNKRNRKSNFDTFINSIEMEVKSNNGDLRNLIMQLVSQLVEGDLLREQADALNSLDYLYGGDIEDALRESRDNLRIYAGLVDRFNAELIDQGDLENDQLLVKPGSLPYLAMTSHSLSHTKLWKKVKSEIKDSFVSGVNSGYKKK